MNAWSVFNKATGELIGQTFSTDQHDPPAPIDIPDGHGVIEGLHNHLCKRVDVQTKQVIDYQPPQPSTDHEWNPETKRWVLKPEVIVNAEKRAAAAARIAELEASQHTWIRRHVLGDKAALAHLQEIDDEVAVLTGEL
jgi:hypothetical protein